MSHDNERRHNLVRAARLSALGPLAQPATAQPGLSRLLARSAPPATAQLGFSRRGRLCELALGPLAQPPTAQSSLSRLSELAPPAQPATAQSSLSRRLRLALGESAGAAPIVDLTSHDTIQRVWEKGHVILGRDPRIWRRDDYKAVVKRSDYGNRDSEYGWELDHIRPRSTEGSDTIDNLRPLQWRANVGRSRRGRYGGK